MRRDICPTRSHNRCTRWRVLELRYFGSFVWPKAYFTVAWARAPASAQELNPPIPLFGRRTYSLQDSLLILAFSQETSDVFRLPVALPQATVTKGLRPNGLYLKIAQHLNAQASESLVMKVAAQRFLECRWWGYTRLRFLKLRSSFHPVSRPSRHTFLLCTVPTRPVQVERKMVC